MARTLGGRAGPVSYPAWLDTVNVPAGDTITIKTQQTLPGKRMSTVIFCRKQAPPQGQVTALSHCSDTYVVKTADGKVNRVWEFNLRLKTDTSPLGPWRGKPVIVGAGMQGDRASIVFSSPDEISSFIKESCE